MTAERYCGEANVMHFLNNYRTRITKKTQYELTIVRKFVKVVAKKCSQILLRTVEVSEKHSLSLMTGNLYQVQGILKFCIKLSIFKNSTIQGFQ